MGLCYLIPAFEMWGRKPFSSVVPAKAIFVESGIMADLITSLGDRSDEGGRG